MYVVYLNIYDDGAFDFDEPDSDVDGDVDWIHSLEL